MFHCASHARAILEAAPADNLNKSLAKILISREAIQSRKTALSNKYRVLPHSLLDKRYLDRDRFQQRLPLTSEWGRVSVERDAMEKNPATPVPPHPAIELFGFISQPRSEARFRASVDVGLD
ncbi:hypothetical protein HN011_012004 [Eciton burchellii]|nr:hypothetical protein HN011_012004 [Eciton burchellii]